MPTSFSPAQIDRFKREAKQLHRADDIPHSQALDRIANANGYSNWSLLMKHSDASGAQHAGAQPQWLVFSRSTETMRQMLRTVPTPRWGGGTRDKAARQQVADICGDLVSPQNAVAYAIAYVTCLLTVPRFKLYSGAPAYWEMRSWLPYCANGMDGDLRILVNRGYQPVGQVERERVRYEEFPHLHAHVTPEQCARFSAPEASEGYLFNDGCPPWESRADAAAYLGRLKQLQNALKR